MIDNESGVELLERADMAKKKATDKPKASQEILMVYKADKRTAPEVRKWLEDLAADVGAPVSVMVDIALKAYADQRKFRPMPKRRTR